MACVTRTAGVRQRSTEAADAVIAVTSVGEAVDHAVRLDDLAAGVAQGCGQYLAVCGQRFWCAPMVAPFGRECPACRVVLAAPCDRSGSVRTRPTRRRGRHRCGRA
jgi:hypothetical protein